MQKRWKTTTGCVIAAVVACAHMAWTDDFLRRRLQVGELAALRELRAKMRKPVNPHAEE